ncbi:hypothetical protein AVEN_10032-1 [Araneus ventricosus]|uniref:Uncharacterized protein n=1 Tax=Araneus ventricosus TaxID=182803 RepID=A0A4Y2H4Y7_ARAVE|nr:hypothetical protein AVEN_10032-1 [Araneus ventricosus]
MQTSPSEKFFKSGKSTKELVLRLGQSEYEDINALISNADPNSRFPQLNPFTLQSFIKDKINRHTSIQNMKFTRQGKIILTTQDPVCAAQLLTLEKVVNTPVSTNVIWENITSRFLLYDIPTTVSLPEATSVYKMLQFHASLKGLRKDTSLSFMWCNSFGNLSSSTKMRKLSRDHSATSKGCPLYIKEQNIMELKCRNHLTTAEARRIYNQSAKVNYASAVKANAPINDIEGQINGKMEAMLLKMNEKIESVIQTFNAKMEQQANKLVEMFERLVESLLQNFTAINKLGGETISPFRKKKAVDKLRKASGIPMQLDAGAIG